ncbi:phosphate ABC transporter, inner membrane subunit PstC [Nitrosococcus halophilus Nc 4]|uniref:Phosphate transport system permease protein n=1 Tax=Nitrosococcus halophilus (strain Nc4) TaxID=472759 RepID=D5BYQ2_NITHN|nr:phosphate ABC transporter, inner membrane subunit PstC [Nitrosococcus halophilus Nc 4]
MISSRNNILSLWRNDKLLAWCLRGCASIAGLIILLIIVFLALEAIPALQQVGASKFFFDRGWHPSPLASEGHFNLAPMLVGTLMATGGAILLATPLGIGAALFCHYYAPPFLARLYRRLIELLAGIPSVIYGLWGLVVLVPLIRQLEPPGPSLLAGILILALMILPTIALLADAALAGLPREYTQGAAALGFSRFSLIWHVALPAAKSGLLTGILLGTMRALGETMAVLMVCGNVVQVPGNIFDPIRTLTANIALEMAYAMGDHRSALFVSGLLLMALVMALIATVEILKPKSSP